MVSKIFLISLYLGIERAGREAVSIQAEWHQMIKACEQNLAGRPEKYGPLSWPITARVLTERYNYTYSIVRVPFPSVRHLCDLSGYHDLDLKTDTLMYSSLATSRFKCTISSFGIFKTSGQCFLIALIGYSNSGWQICYSYQCTVLDFAARC